MGKLLALMICAGFGGAQAQQDPPDAKIDSTLESASASKDDKHILGLVPNFDTVNQPSSVYHSISTREKFKLASEDVFDPFSFLITGIYAGAAQWANASPGYGQGAQGYAKRYGGYFADGLVGNYLTEAIMPTVFREDPRYFRLGRGGNWRRIGYAVTRVLVTRTDAGGQQFNFSEITGNLMGAGISSLYYPAANRTVEDTFEKFSLSVVSDAGFNVLKEFWPDMRRKVLHKGDPEPGK
jgi:hypothetical protein